MSLSEVCTLIAMIVGALSLGVCFGILWERKNSDAEWARWVNLSERVSSMSGAWEHDMYVFEDRLGRLEDNLAWTQEKCLDYPSEEHKD